MITLFGVGIAVFIGCLWYFISRCMSEHVSGLVCTKRWLHRGGHVAHDDHGNVLLAWSRHRATEPITGRP